LFGGRSQLLRRGAYHFYRDRDFSNTHQFRVDRMIEQQSQFPASREPVRTRRSFTRDTPRGLFGSIGLMAAHS
jgi:hypothetical protein